MLLMLPGTTTRRTASKFFRDSSSFHIVRPGGSGCSRSGVPDAWHEMQRAWPGRLARKIGCTCVLNISKSSDGFDGGWPAQAAIASVRATIPLIMNPLLPPKLARARDERRRKRLALPYQAIA